VEEEALRCQIGTLKRNQHLPYAFTEQGVAMLSSVLRTFGRNHPEAEAEAMEGSVQKRLDRRLYSGVWYGHCDTKRS